MTRFALIALIAVSIAAPAFAGETVAIRKGTKTFQVVNSKTESAPVGQDTVANTTASAASTTAETVAAIAPAAGAETSTEGASAQPAGGPATKPAFAHSLPRK